MSLVSSVPDAAAIRRRFDATGAFTVGLEEEAMLLDPETLDLLPCAEAVLDRLEGDPRFKREMPASQLEIVCAPAASVPEAIAQLAAGRRELTEAAAGLARPAAAGVHPFAAARGALNPGPRYDATHAAYGPVAEQQLVTSLQVHVAIGGAERTLSAYEALRGLLPEIAALAANGPFYAGADTGLASIRPLIAGQLPRQGLPPAITSWDAFAEELRWGQAAGALHDAGGWWWELRPHAIHGTLEFRVPDAQTTVAEAAGVATFVQALCATVAAACEAGESRPTPATWRIAENRFSALRHGLDARLADLETGQQRTARERLRELVAWVTPAAIRLGAEDLLPFVEALVEENGALRQRRVAAQDGLRGLVGWLAERYQGA